MTTSFKEYTVDIVDEAEYRLASTDNSYTYDRVYSEFVITGDVLYVCCSNAVYSLRLPALTPNWKKKLDAATCFAIYPFKGDFIIHGELEVKRIAKDGKVKWDFSAKDIFVTPEGGEAVKFIGDKIELTDWDGDRYLLNEDGRLSK